MSATADDPTQAADPYELHAQGIVEEVEQAWRKAIEAGHAPDLTARARRAMADAARHQTRQVLARTATQLDLAAEACRSQGDADPFLKRYEAIREDLDRAAGLLDVYLDEEALLKRLMDLDTEPLDLSQALIQRLELADAFLHQVTLDTHVDPVFVEGDRMKLLDLLASLTQRFQALGHAGDVVEISFTADPPWARGFIGLNPPRLTPSELTDALAENREQGPSFDLPRAQAVLELHGGSLYVERSQGGATGFGFELPLIQHGDAP